MLISQLDILIPYLSLIFQIILVIIIPLVIMEVIVKTLQKYDDKNSLGRTPIKVLITSIKYLTIILIFGLILAVLGIDLKSLIVSLGLVSVAVSLAAKDTFSNMISGMILMLEKKFKVGDLIEVDGQMGKVVKIGFKSVELCYKSKYISVPNVIFSTKSFTNYTKYGVYPVTFKINISNKYDFEEKIGQLDEILNNCELILKEPSYLILPMNITAYGVDVTIKFFIEDPLQNNKIKAKLIRAIKKSILIEDTA